MKNSLKGMLLVLSIIALVGCGDKTEPQTPPTPSEPVDTTPTQATEITQPVEENIPDLEENTTTEERIITKEMAYEGVNNYINSIFGENISEEERALMSVTNGEETETWYEIVFRSYTGAHQYFYVDKVAGNTRILEENPVENTKEEIGIININEYLNQN